MAIILQTHYDACALPEIELIDMVKEHNTLFTINCGDYFCFGIFHSKYVILLGLCLVLANNLLS